MKPRKTMKRDDPERRETERREFFAKLRRDADAVGAVAEVLLPFPEDARRRILRMVAVHFALDELLEGLRGGSAP